MKKSMYSTDIIWYDESVKSAIEELNAQYPNAIPVFGGAYQHPNTSTVVFPICPSSYPSWLML